MFPKTSSLHYPQSFCICCSNCLECISTRSSYGKHHSFQVSFWLSFVLITHITSFSFPLFLLILLITIWYLLVYLFISLPLHQSMCFMTAETFSVWFTAQSPKKLWNKGMPIVWSSLPNWSTCWRWGYSCETYIYLQDLWQRLFP